MNICHRCGIFEDHETDLMEQIETYIKGLDPAVKCSEDVYEERLSACRKCDALHRGLCKFCGCFVMVRARKKSQSCPYPGNQKW